MFKLFAVSYVLNGISKKVVLGVDTSTNQKYLFSNETGLLRDKLVTYLTNCRIEKSYNGVGNETLCKSLVVGYEKGANVSDLKYIGDKYDLDYLTTQLAAYTPTSTESVKNALGNPVTLTCKTKLDFNGLVQSVKTQLNKIDPSWAANSLLRAEVSPSGNRANITAGPHKFLLREVSGSSFEIVCLKETDDAIKVLVKLGQMTSSPVTGDIP